MIWQKIKVSPDSTHFSLDGEKLFGMEFIEVLKFHAPGLAPVKDQSGSYHIDENGMSLYPTRYLRTFGFYCNRAAVISNDGWFHIDSTGIRVYCDDYAWVGNFQEDKCTVRSKDGYYFHIDLKGIKIYPENYTYAGDFKDGYACVRLSNGLYRHINHQGKPINEKLFLDLGVFHKNYATAKDKDGWFHIDKAGNALYSERYELVEPFYNGCALISNHAKRKLLIDELGKVVIVLE